MKVDCATCEFAERDSHNRFVSMCSGSGNCAYEPFQGEVKPFPIEQMKELLRGAVMSKFVSVATCQAYRDGIMDCIKIMECE